MQTNAHQVRSSIARRELSRHAARRVRQRGFTDASVNLILAFGEKEYDGHGALRYLMTTRAMAALASAVGRTAQVDALQGAYAVLSIDGSTVITVGHRYS
jgi:hypothetical protein